MVKLSYFHTRVCMERKIVHLCMKDNLLGKLLFIGLTLDSLRSTHCNTWSCPVRL